MPRIMYDAVTAANIPVDARMVAGYIDKIKLEPWSAADWARFPNAVKVQIVKKASTNAGHVLDVEPGDATPAQAPGWARMRRQSGFAWPTIYCNLSTWPVVIQAFKDQGVPMPLWWIAHYDGKQNFPTLQGQEAIAKQYLGDQAPGIDLNWVKDNWPGVDGEQDMALTDDDLNKIHTKVWYSWIWSQNNGATGQNASTALDMILSANRNLAQSVLALKDLIIADDANDVTADAVAQAVKGAISADVMAAITAALQGVEIHADIDKDALINALFSQLVARLSA